VNFPDLSGTAESPGSRRFANRWLPIIGTQPPRPVTGAFICSGSVDLKSKFATPTPVRQCAALEGGALDRTQHPGNPGDEGRTRPDRRAREAHRVELDLFAAGKSDR
jgi:hypothetical protein